MSVSPEGSCIYSATPKEIIVAGSIRSFRLSLHMFFYRLVIIGGCIAWSRLDGWLMSLDVYICF